MNAAGIWDTIAGEAERESRVWGDALREPAEREPEEVFSRLADDRFRLGVETIYEGYLVHYGRPRLFAAPDDDTGLLLGDYLYAHGLARIAALGEVEAVAALSELIARCAHLRADDAEGDGEAWAEAMARLGGGDAGARDRVLAAHTARVG